MARKKKEPNRVDDLLDELLEDCQSPEDILGEGGLMNQLKKRLVERALAGELNGHLKREAAAEAAVPNSRNGSSKKTVQSETGELELSIPRDRNGSFEPVLVPKHQRRIVGLDEKILALYARGNSVRDISAQLEELYGGAKISSAVISEVIESVSEEVKAWQSRPLDDIYPIVYLDALYVNIKVSGRVSKRAVYVVLGIDREGNKQLLGLWVGEAETEGAKFWLKVLTDLKNRGLKDILIACCDGLKGFPQAIEAVYPHTQVQLCIVHLMSWCAFPRRMRFAGVAPLRNCMKYVPWKERKAVAADLKPIYQAATLAESEAALDAFADKWDEAYPAVSQVWIRHWENVIPIFNYSMEIRRVIYTTNAIESLNRSLRKVIKTKAIFPNEDAVFRLMYLAMNNIAKKWNRPIKNCGATPRRFAALGNAHQDWRSALSQFAILFPDRFSA